MQGDGFTMVPNVVLADWAALPDELFRTYVVMIGFIYKASTTTLFPSQQTLAALRGIHVKTLRTHLAALEAMGFIVKTRRGLGRTNLYEVVDLDEIYDDANRSNVTLRVGDGDDRDARSVRRAVAVREMRIRAQEYRSIRESRVNEVKVARRKRDSSDDLRAPRLRRVQ